MPFVSSVRGSFGLRKNPFPSFLYTTSNSSIGGGTISTAGGYRIHTFTTAGLSNFTITPNESRNGTTPSFSGFPTIEYFIWGGGGGGGNAGGWSYGAAAGGGGAAQGSFTVTGSSYQIMVGSNGQYASQNSSGSSRACCSRNFGGGAPSKATDGDNRYTGSGGGLSGVFTTYDVAGALIIAGGGGGGGASRAGTGNVGGAGGGTTGADGSAPYDSQSARRGRGGTQTGVDQPTGGQDASFQPGQLLGGCIDGYGGGGGGGWWGGSGGTYSETNTMAGGGGGSGYLKPGIGSGTLYTGSGQTPGNSGGTYRTSNGYSAGDGAGVQGDGSRGLVVLRYLI